jgi:hypothetical protein
LCGGGVANVLRGERASDHSRGTCADETLPRISAHVRALTRREAYLVVVVSDPNAIPVDLALFQQRFWSIRDKGTVDDRRVEPISARVSSAVENVNQKTELDIPNGPLNRIEVGSKGEELCIHLSQTRQSVGRRGAVAGGDEMIVRSLIAERSDSDHCRRNYKTHLRNRGVVIVIGRLEGGSQDGTVEQLWLRVSSVCDDLRRRKASAGEPEIREVAATDLLIDGSSTGRLSPDGDVSRVPAELKANH